MALSAIHQIALYSDVIPRAAGLRADVTPVQLSGIWHEKEFNANSLTKREVSL